MKTCYLCDVELNELNKSEEHILLNAIGGKLKSRDLLCKECNSKIGNKPDAELARELNFLSSFFQVDRDRGENQPLKGGSTASGETYDLYNGTTPVLSKIKYKEEQTNQGVKFSVTVRNERELRKIFTGLKKKKYPGLDVEDVVKKSVLKNEQLREPLNYKQQVGTDISLKSVLKSAIDFYVFIRSEKEEVKHLFKYLTSSEVFNGIKCFHVDDGFYQIGVGEVSHNIFLVGDKKSRILYCYLEFFSSFPFLITLSLDYGGESFSSSYSYDVILQRKIKKTFNFPINRVIVETKILHPNIVEIANRRLLRTMGLVDTGLFHSFIRKVVEKERAKMLEKYPGIKNFNEEQKNELLSKVNPRLSEYIVRNGIIVERRK
jgi:hypothetical protein